MERADTLRPRDAFEGGTGSIREPVGPPKSWLQSATTVVEATRDTAALDGEVLPAGLRLAGAPQMERPAPGTWTVHYVSLSSGGAIEGMDRDAALRLAAELGGRAYEAPACISEHRVVFVGEWKVINPWDR